MIRRNSLFRAVRMCVDHTQITENEQPCGGNVHIPPAPWAAGGLDVVAGRLPLSLLPSRASDPAPFDPSRVYTAFANVYEVHSESLQTCNAN